MNDAELVKSRLDIVDVIGGYVELKKAGKDHRGNSPFRQERTPSFYVSPEKQIWYDFGSNEGGDLISFVMRIEGLSFPEALELLAERAGVKLTHRPSSQDANKSGKPRLYAALKQALSWYHLRLSQDSKALDYLKKQRGLKSETIKTFLIGYAPDEWSALTDWLKQQGFSESELLAAGLAGRRTGSQGIYDLFRNRIMFPVFDAQARPIGFSGRALKDTEKTAKYINTPDTAIYHKAQAIFGFHQAKAAIRNSKSVVIVEGHLDAITLAQHGISNVVAVSGTALSFDQLKILGRTVETIQLCFDQDSAGQKATQRAIELAAPLPARVEVITYTEAKDPDELIRKDPNLWETAVSSAQYSLDYLMSQAATSWPPNNGPNKKRFVQALLPVLERINDRVEQEHYIASVAAQAGVDNSLIRELIGRVGQPRVSRIESDKKTAKSKTILPARQTRAQQMEDLLLEMMMAYPETRVVLQDLNPSDISEANRPLFEALLKDPTISLDKLAKLLPDQAERVKILGLRGDHEYSAMTEHERGLEAFTQVHSVQKHIAVQKKRQISRAIAQAEQADDMATAADLLRQYQQLVQDESVSY